MSKNVVIRVDNLWKRYGLSLPYFIRQGQQKLRSLRERLKPLNRYRMSTQLDGPWALSDVSFDVRQGETLGIIGRNGAGKSTLLKVLAGVTPLTSGQVEVIGRVFPMIELNAGLHPELTGRENVHLLGAVMGLSRREIEITMPEIEEFCELGEWFERPVWMYSSGMLARLGFGVAMNVDANVLLVDEVLAVGDLAFQRKCYRRLEELRSEGITTLFVSHSVRQVERLCDRVIVLDNGRVACDNSAEEAVNYYFEKIDKDQLQLLAQDSMRPVNYSGTGEIVVTRVVIVDGDGRPTNTLRMSEDIAIRIEFYAETKVESPIFGVGILTFDLIQVILQTNGDIPDRADCEGSGSISCTFSGLNLAPGAYSIKVGIKGNDGRPIYKATGLTSFRVQSDSFTESRVAGGVVYADTIWRS